MNWPKELNDPTDMDQTFYLRAYDDKEAHYWNPSNLIEIKINTNQKYKSKGIYGATFSLGKRNSPQYRLHQIEEGEMHRLYKQFKSNEL